MTQDLKNYIRQERIETLQAQDGYTLHFRVWQAVRPKGSVLYLAGIESHGGWYQASASYLLSKGYNVYFLDRRGSGLNTQQRGDMPSFKMLFCDLDDMLEKILCDYPRQPIHLMALSWGGKWALGWCLSRRPEDLASLTLVTPGLVRQVDSSFFKKIAITLAAFLAPGVSFSIPIQISQYTCDEKWRQFIEKDALRLKTLTARFLKEDFFLDQFIRRTSRCVPCRAKLFLAGQDTIINNDKTRQLFASKTQAQSDIQVYPASTHTLEFEQVRESYFQDVVHWLGRAC
jgi:alpha-beta hydrolase superfamily lysophospholipase